MRIDITLDMERFIRNAIYCALETSWTYSPCPTEVYCQTAGIAYWEEDAICRHPTTKGIYVALAVLRTTP